MIKSISTILLLLLLFNCAARQQDEAMRKNQPKAGTNEAFKISAGENFNTFWATFKQAVLSSDTSQLKGLCTFPLKYRGPADEDPIVEIPKNQFTGTFALFLQQWAGADLEGSTELDNIKKIVKPKQRIGSVEIRIGDMIFYLIHGKWKLNFLYLNQETIDLLEKRK